MRFQWYVVYNDGFQTSGQFGASSNVEAKSKAYAIGQALALSHNGIKEVMVEVI